MADKPHHLALTADASDWQTVTGPAGDSLHVAFVRHEGRRFTLLRDDNDTVLVYDQAEWDAFIAGAKDGEFDR